MRTESSTTSRSHRNTRPSTLSTHYSALASQVRQQAVKAVRIGRWDDAWTAQMTLALPRFMRQLMAHKRMLHLILAGSRLAETLGGASFRLQLWHNNLRKGISLTPCARESIAGSLAYAEDQLLRSISSRILARHSSTGIGPRSLPPRKRTATFPAATSRSPTTSMYGIFSVCASRIL